MSKLLLLSSNVDCEFFKERWGIFSADLRANSFFDFLKNLFYSCGSFHEALRDGGFLREDYYNNFFLDPNIFNLALNCLETEEGNVTPDCLIINKDPSPISVLKDKNSKLSHSLILSEPTGTLRSSQCIGYIERVFAYLSKHVQVFDLKDYFNNA